MAEETDRRTTIDGDQIRQHTINPEELYAEGTEANYKSLIYNSLTEKFKWMHQLIQGKIFK
jgi:hypothetical protein